MHATDRHRRRPYLLWGGVAALLLAWNGCLALYANPFLMIQHYDGTQYHLLVRNRLRGHHEVGDSAHTVRDEGQHPIWRPGLVVIEEQLARWTGSIRTAAGLASVLGGTLLELALLWLAGRCLGRWAAVLLLVALLSPVKIGVLFLIMAIGQGPEPWAAAVLLWGLAALVEAVRRRSWTWALTAGVVAGSAELFRTGNYLLFLLPCLVYAFFALRPWDRRGVVLPLASLFAFAVTIAATSAALPSPVNKTVVNLWHRLVEIGGPHVPHDFPDVGTIEMLPGGLMIAPGTDEAYYDYIVRQARTLSTRDFLRERGPDILAVYFDGLKKVATQGAWGLRLLIGEFVFACLFAGIVVSLARRDGSDRHALAFAAGGLAHYLGPVVLLRHDDPNHYLFVAIPLLLLTAVHGLVRVAQLAWGWFAARRPAAADIWHRARRAVLFLAALPVVVLAVIYYQGSLHELRKLHEQTAEEQAALDALHLEGRKVVVRNMSWFVDRDVQTVLLPYATADELARYTRRQGADGLLLWADEKQLVLRFSPHGKETNDLDAPLRSTGAFDEPQVSGAWRWYPLRTPAVARTTR